MKIKTQQQFVDRLQELNNSNVEISRKKNSDYSGAVDPFSNFRVCEALGIPAEVGLIVRITDKVARASNLILSGKKAAVVDESVIDTLKDLSNYSMILCMYLEDKYATD